MALPFHQLFPASQLPLPSEGPTPLGAQVFVAAPAESGDAKRAIAKIIESLLFMIPAKFV
jgi:hypothetical protein